MIVGFKQFKISATEKSSTLYSIIDGARMTINPVKLLRSFLGH